MTMVGLVVVVVIFFCLDIQPLQGRNFFILFRVYHLATLFSKSDAIYEEFLPRHFRPYF